MESPFRQPSENEEDFDAMIRNLKNSGLVSESADLLTWTGPKEVL